MLLTVHHTLRIIPCSLQRKKMGKYFYWFLFLSCSLVTMSGACKPTPAPRTLQMGDHPEIPPPVSQSNFNFSSALLKELPKNGNHVFSPFSLALVLLVARFGARGQTAAQIEKALRLPATNGDLDGLVAVRRGFSEILRRIGTDSPDTTVTVASRMFIEAGFEIDRTFKTTSQQTVNVTVTPLNFTDGLNASETINSWVREETNGKVTEVFKPHSIKDDTKIVLVNAIYFKSPWKHPFNKLSTKRADFHGRRKLRVMTMVSEDEFSYGDVPELSARVVSVPYKGDRFSMQVFIPTALNGLGTILEQMNATTNDNIRMSLRAPGSCEKVRLHLPKFQIQSSHDLAEPLLEMGVTDMFRASWADFSGIPLNSIDAPNLFVSEVIQKAFISVDEEGTEASAATGIRTGPTCMPTVTEIKADRPFYYQIVEDATNTVLFAGVVRSPTA